MGSPDKDYPLYRGVTSRDSTCATVEIRRGVTAHPQQAVNTLDFLRMIQELTCM